MTYCEIQFVSLATLLLTIPIIGIAFMLPANAQQLEFRSEKSKRMSAPYGRPDKFTEYFAEAKGLNDGYDPYPQGSKIVEFQRAMLANAKRAGTTQLECVERGPGRVGGRTRALLFDPTVNAFGSTIIFDADACKVNPDATAEDLLAKLPGIVVQDGQVEAKGEQVQRVTVDGREFFCQNPAAALRNLPADVIQNVEVFDRGNDQVQFTGFDDGNSERTINITTRRGMSNSQFGQFYGGYGDDQRYITGGNTNIFDSDRRIAIIDLSNNEICRNRKHPLGSKSFRTAVKGIS